MAAKNNQLNINIADIVGKGYSRFWNDRTCRYVVCKGSRGSKKSKTTALWIIYHMMKYSDANTLVVRRVYNTLYDSCYADLRWAMNKLGVSHLWDCQKIPLRMIYKPSGNQIIFRGMDNMESITSIAVPSGYLCWVWCEEFSQCEDEFMFDTLDYSIRGELPSYLWFRFMITFNPYSDKHWLKKRFFDNPDKNTLSMTTTFRCNEWLGEDVRAMMMDLYKTNPNKARILCDGDWGISEGLIYENVEFRLFDIEEVARNPSFTDIYGLDYGYKDPSTLVCAYISKFDKEIYVYDEFYKSGVTNKDLIKMLIDKGLDRCRIVCDSAEPKSIEEMKRGGINATPCVKGKGSVDFGIQLVQNYKIIVHPKCEEFIREISNYNYLDNGKPNHDFSHLMDALRYSVTYYERGLPKPKKRLRKDWFI